MNASTYAFKLIEHYEQRFDRIEALLGRLADAKDDRETAAELSAQLKASTELLKSALPSGTPQT